MSQEPRTVTQGWAETILISHNIFIHLDARLHSHSSPKWEILAKLYPGLALQMSPCFQPGLCGQLPDYRGPQETTASALPYCIATCTGPSSAQPRAFSISRLPEVLEQVQVLTHLPSAKADTSVSRRNTLYAQTATYAMNSLHTYSSHN